MLRVNQIAKILNVNEETVRRWICQGELTSTKNSRKHGNIVSESDFKNFLRDKPKYMELYSCYKQTYNPHLTNLIYRLQEVDKQIEELELE